MATEKIEVEVGKKPTGPTPAGKVGSSQAQKPKSEVGGRMWVERMMRCWHCGGVSWINYDTENFQSYTCCFCGAENTL